MFFLDRALSVEERIKRAEEIYSRRRRQNMGVRVNTNTSNTESKPNYKLFRKMMIQILTCVTIYIIFYVIQNTNYIFSTDVIDRTREILSYDINFQKIYGSASTYFNNWLSKINEARDDRDELVPNKERG